MLEKPLPDHLLAEMGQAVRPLVQIRLVNLEDITGKHHLRTFSCTCDNGLDFVRSEILSLVDNKEGLAQAAAAYICQRRDEKFLILQQSLYLQSFLD